VQHRVCDWLVFQWAPCRLARGVKFIIVSILTATASVTLSTADLYQVNGPPDWIELLLVLNGMLFHSMLCV